MQIENVFNDWKKKYLKAWNFLVSHANASWSLTRIGILSFFFKKSQIMSCERLTCIVKIFFISLCVVSSPSTVDASEFWFGGTDQFDIIYIMSATFRVEL